MSGVAPQNDEHGRPIHLELCPVCDTGDVDRPAAGLLVQWFADRCGHARAESRFNALQRLVPFLTGVRRW